MEVRSKHGILIRLTEERWNHIIDEHGELAELRAEILSTVSDLERILAGNMGGLPYGPLSSVNGSSWSIVRSKRMVL